MSRAEVAAEPPPPEPARARAYGTDTGRFFVIAEPGMAGARLARLAEEAWSVWSGPLALPPRWTSAVTVRLTPAGRWAFAETGWRVVVEPGGVVSVWIRGDDALAADAITRERRWLTALAEGALRRQAAALAIAPERTIVPDWLTVAAAEAVLVRGNPALGDEWRRVARAAAVLPSLRETLNWAGAQTADGAEAERRWLAAYGVWLWLQAEAGRGPAWRRLVTGLLEGVSPGLALVRGYEPRFAAAEARDIELAWQVGAAAQAVLRTVPTWPAAESRRRLEQAARVTVRPLAGETEEAKELAELWAERGDPLLTSVRRARLA
ncbi:MAG: hypothetical protein MUE42_11825, partial [Opitutaceae bacterium]|nr:hypothetical protein [Opitutaceae bacterium]